MKKYLQFLILFLLLITQKVYAKEISNQEFMNEFKVGWNLGNDLDSYYGEWNGEINLSQETIWGQPKATQEIIDYVLDSGINVIRIPVTWHNHTYKDENGIYHIHEEWLARVKEVVDYAYNRNAYVIINTHHDDDYIYLTSNEDDFNNNVIPYVTSIWTEIADYFKDYDEHLLFESYNEIYEVTAGMYYTDIGANQMNILNQLFVNIVRNTGGNNRTRLLMIPTLAHGTSQSTFENFEVPTDITDNKLILTVHFYSNALDQDIEEKLANMKNYADELNLPLVIDEYGTQVSQDKRIEKISNYTARAYKLGIRTMIWDNGSDFMLFNRSDLSLSKHDVIEALTNPHEYNTINKTALSNYENDWVFARADNSGNINPNSRPEWWGTILTQRKEAIPDNAEYLTLLLKNDNDSRGLAIHQIYFYDIEGNFLSAISSNYPGYTLSTFKIPDEAASFKLSIYDAKVNTSQTLFINDFSSGDLSLTYGLISDNLFTIGDEICLDATNNSSNEQPNNSNTNDDTSNINDLGDNTENNSNTDEEANHGIENNDNTSDELNSNIEVNNNTDEKLSDNIEANNNTDEKLSDNIEANNNTDEKLSDNIEANNNTDEKLSDNIEANSNTDEKLSDNIEANNNTDEKLNGNIVNGNIETNNNTNEELNSNIENDSNTYELKNNTKNNNNGDNELNNEAPTNNKISTELVVIITIISLITIIIIFQTIKRKLI